MTDIFQIKIPGSPVKNKGVSCTGGQLAEIMVAIKDLGESFIWYGVDILAPGQRAIQLFERAENGKQVPWKLGSTSDLVKFSSSVSQFERGLFLAVDSSIGDNVHWSLDEFDTEDQDYIEPSIMIIRAFDTSYFEILAKEQAIIDRLKCKFAEADSA